MVQPGLRQKPSSVAERGVKIHDGSELYPAGVGRDRAYAAGDPHPNVVPQGYG